jgi:hypothetical protein
MHAAAPNDIGLASREQKLERAKVLGDRAARYFGFIALSIPFFMSSRFIAGDS